MQSEQYEDSYKTFQEMVDIGLNLNKSFSSLLNYVREEYIEIDIEEASNNSFKNKND